MRFNDSQTFHVQPDMTPMLDCTFQLTFFFMLTLNFSTDTQSELIHLPVSEIAKPVPGAMSSRVTVQLLVSGLVLFGGDQMTVAALEAPLQRERDMIKAVLGRSIDDAMVVIRADRHAPVGKLQEVIRLCQNTGFVKFVLRARTP